MKKYIVTFTLLIAIALTACAYPKKIRTKKTKPSGITVTSIQMTRGACFGRCPSYTVSIESNGNAAYQGRTFAPYEGEYVKTFSPQQVAALFAEFSKYRLDTCQENYKVMLPDLPGMDFTLIINGKEKTIRNASFGPDFFRVLAIKVDATVKIDDTWRKISNTEKQ